MRLIDADLITTIIKTSLNRELREGNISKGGHEDVVLNLFVEFINEAPTIEAEPVKHGKWKVDKYYNGTLTRYECSVCGAKDYFDYNYCPDCGARMDGDKL